MEDKIKKETKPLPKFDDVQQRQFLHETLEAVGEAQMQINEVHDDAHK